MTDPEEPSETETEPGAQRGYLMSYVDWMMSGSIITVALKVLWTGMWITALSTFQWVKAVVIIIVGAGIWFFKEDYQNWYIEIE